VALLFYAGLMRRDERSANRSGNVLGGLLALLLALGAGAVLTLGHAYIVQSADRMHHAPLPISLATIFAAAVCSRPAVIRFLPIFKDPELRKLVLSILSGQRGSLSR